VVARDFRKLSKIAAVAASDKKAVDIRVLDIRKESDVMDYMVIAEAQSSPQMRALADSIEQTLHAAGVRLLHRDGGARGGRWMALDYGGLVVHILMTEARAFYRLESLWERAKTVRWKKKAKKEKVLR